MYKTTIKTQQKLREKLERGDSVYFDTVFDDLSPIHSHNMDPGKTLQVSYTAFHGSYTCLVTKNINGFTVD